MSENSSSSNDSLLHPLPFSICIISRPSSFFYFAFYLTHILLLLPLCIFILYLGLKRWQQRRSTVGTAAVSHFDCFTFHMAAMELVGELGLILCSCGVFTTHVKTYWFGYCLYSVSWYGELFTNILTCMERFLAISHPIMYLSLRGDRGVRIRNVCIGCVWLLSFGETFLLISKDISAMVDVFIMIGSLTVISFCSLSVLCVLIRPGPGQQGGDREKLKQRAFFTIVVILGVLLLRCLWNLTWASLFVSKTNWCMISALGVWFNLPTSLVLPLLFLHRTGLLGFCRNTK